MARNDRINRRRRHSDPMAEFEELKLVVNGRVKGAGIVSENRCGVSGVHAENPGREQPTKGEEPSHQPPPSRKSRNRNSSVSRNPVYRPIKSVAATTKPRVSG